MTVSIGDWHLSTKSSQSKWPSGCAGPPRLLGLWVRIPPEGLDICLFVSVICCQIYVSASGTTLVQRSPIECGVSEYDREASIMRRTTRG